MIGTYRKKPVVVKAVQLVYDPEDWLEIIDFDFLEDVAEWCGGSIEYGPRAVTGIAIQTLEGVMRAELGDWIIRGVKGEFYPCKPDIFEATYEPVEATAHK